MLLLLFLFNQIIKLNIIANNQITFSSQIITLNIIICENIDNGKIIIYDWMISKNNGN